MKRISNGKTINDNNRARTMQENWEIMRPFVHFSIKAMALIGGAMIGIIKLLPTLLEHREDAPKKSNKIIKI